MKLECSKKYTGRDVMSAEIKAFVCSVIAIVASYLVLMNLPLQLPGNFQLPKFSNFIFSFLFGAVCYAILVETFQDD